MIDFSRQGARPSGKSFNSLLYSNREGQRMHASRTFAARSGQWFGLTAVMIGRTTCGACSRYGGIPLPRNEKPVNPEENLRMNATVVRSLAAWLVTLAVGAAGVLGCNPAPPEARPAAPR